MDYDLTDIPKGYDRARDHGPEHVDLWMNAIESLVGSKKISGIVDLGCGTGRFSEGLAARFDSVVTGVDPSWKMLEQAKAKRKDDRVRYVSGDSQSMPLPSQSVDMVFMSMSFHHFNDPADSIRECMRILREQGFVILRTGTREQISSYPYVPFFPSCYPILETILLTFNDTAALFESFNFTLTASKIVKQTISQNWINYADKISAHGDSVLEQLNEDDFRAGMDALRAHSEKNGNMPVVEPIDLFVFQK